MDCSYPTEGLSWGYSFATPWTIAGQAPLSMEFSRQEYWNGLPFPSSLGLPNPGVKLVPSALAGIFFTAEPPGKPTSPHVGYSPWGCKRFGCDLVTNATNTACTC